MNHLNELLCTCNKKRNIKEKDSELMVINKDFLSTLTHMQRLRAQHNLPDLTPGFVLVHSSENTNGAMLYLLTVFQYQIYPPS